MAENIPPQPAPNDETINVNADKISVESAQTTIHVGSGSFQNQASDLFLPDRARGGAPGGSGQGREDFVERLDREGGEFTEKVGSLAKKLEKVGTSVLPATLSPPTSKADDKNAMSGGVVLSMYDMMFKRYEAGKKTEEGGIPSKYLEAAAQKPGMTFEEFKAFVQKMGVTSAKPSEASQPPQKPVQSQLASSVLVKLGQMELGPILKGVATTQGTQETQGTQSQSSLTFAQRLASASAALQTPMQPTVLPGPQPPPTPKQQQASTSNSWIATAASFATMLAGMLGGKIFPGLQRQLTRAVGAKAGVLKTQEGKDFFENLQANWGEARSRTGEALTSDRFGNIGGNALGAVSSFAAMIPHPAGKAVAVIAKFGEALFKSVERLRDWNDRLHQADMRFAYVSASMARVQAEHEIRQIQLDQERGERRADTARSRTEASDRLNRTLARYEDMQANFQNKMVAKLLDFTNGVVTGLEKLLPKPVQNALNAGAQANQESMANWLDLTTNADWASEYGAPPQFQNGGWLQ